jgi:hypothetical protein
MGALISSATRRSFLGSYTLVRRLRAFRDPAPLACHLGAGMAGLRICFADRLAAAPLFSQSVLFLPHLPDRISSAGDAPLSIVGRESR